MKKIGITGGIGSGKSTVSKIFESIGIPVFYADEAGKYLLQNDKTLKDQVANYFGNEIYKNGVLNRKLLASVVFGNPEELKTLNGFVHPAVGKYFKNWVENQASSYILKEAAILFESGAHKGLDKVVFVKAPQQVRLNRVMKRDGVSEMEVLKRMNIQMPDETKEKLSDFVIDNSGEIELIPQVIKLHENFIS